MLILITYLRGNNVPFLRIEISRKLEFEENIVFEAAQHSDFCEGKKEKKEKKTKLFCEYKSTKRKFLIFWIFDKDYIAYFGPLKLSCFLQ